ncbi:hypothetical protein [uncultured Rubinisphaera sp.]|uniref:hypothetical protein n=1 Tax=uncultured Rubinisphaera sp. TaxID=1678686 RepID=UPI0030DC8C7B|tara:strand:- start:42 stop:416 length:375 start_codon:yes stop_codon:yes gene_type:complete
MFVSRIWFDEVERIGKKKCTPFGYALHGVGDLVGFLGLLMLLGVPVYLIYRAIVGSFHWPLLFLLLVPFAVGVIGVVVVGVSWHLAGRKQFKYDYERRESTWYENGVKHSYTYEDFKSPGKRAG